MSRATDAVLKLFGRFPVTEQPESTREWENFPKPDDVFKEYGYDTLDDFLEASARAAENSKDYFIELSDSALRRRAHRERTESRSSVSE